MAKMRKCPQCGSERIMIDGVEQKKKGVGYFLSGQAMNDMGKKHGYKLGHAIKKRGEPNAKCLNCMYQWIE